MPSISSSERAALADLLDTLGPDAPTLCEGWATRDLAAHLVVRERRPDALPGVAGGPLAGWTEKVQQDYAQRPYAELVQAVRTGPGALSFFSVPGVGKQLNTAEYFVHHEDVRRAQTGWSARPLPDKVQDALWQIVRTRAPLTFRKADCGVVLRRPDGEELTARRGEPVAVVAGEPQELLLYVFGRQSHAMVSVTGSDEAVASVDRLSTGV